MERSKLLIPIQVNSLNIKLQLLNGLLGLTDKELQLLQIFLEINPDSFGRKEERIEAATQIGMSIKVLNNYIKALKSKHVLISTGRTTYKYHPVLSNLDEVEHIEFKLNGSTSV